MRIRPTAAALAIVVLGACSGSTLPADGSVQARAAGNATLAVTNDGDAPILVLAVDPTELMIVAPCLPDTCPRLEPGATLRISYADIAGYQAGDRQASVLWWTPGNAGAPRSDGTVTVEL
jgi:hypothetical protein